MFDKLLIIQNIQNIKEKFKYFNCILNFRTDCVHVANIKIFMFILKL